MKRVIVYCEGPTEETFVNRVLAPFLYPNEVYLSASSCNGISKYSIIRRDLNFLCKSDPTAMITTMLDYYALPSDTPGISSDESGDIYQRVDRIESAIQDDIGDSSDVQQAFGRIQHRNGYRNRFNATRMPTFQCMGGTPDASLSFRLYDQHFLPFYIFPVLPDPCSVFLMPCSFPC